MSGPMDAARAAWGDPLPDWIEALARECEQTSQNRAAERLGRSAALVSGALRRSYRGDMAAVEDRVRAVLMAGVVACPALGEITAADCLSWRDKAADFRSTNMQRVRMFRACRGCARNTKGEAS